MPTFDFQHALGSEASVREQSIALGATPIKKAEGTWRGVDGEIWFVSSYAGGPLADDPGDVTAVAHAGQIWRYSPRRASKRRQVQLQGLLSSLSSGQEARDQPYDFDSAAGINVD